MKHEMSTARPDFLQDSWPGEFDFFSHFEAFASIPQPLFLITTVKENGHVNAGFQAWSSFSGDAGGFYAVMGGLMRHTHTFANIQRTGEFCVNFLNPSYYDACIQTIKHNEDDVDELTAAGLTAEPAKLLRTPRIKEAFLTLECRFVSETDLSGKGLTSLVIGKVEHVAVDDGINIPKDVTGPKGFMYYVHGVYNWQKQLLEPGAVARLEEDRHE